MKHASKDKSFERRMFESLYGSDDFDRGINDALALIGNEFQISRVYIFENSEDNRFGDNTYEWCAEGIIPQIDELQHMSYEEYGYDTLFTETGVFICPDTSRLPEVQKELFESQSIKAILQYAIYNKGEFDGFVGFDDCRTSRHDWSEDGDELDALMFLSQLLSVYLIKERNVDRAELYQKKMRKALEYEDLFNKLANGVGIYELRDGSIRSRYLNDGYYRMLHTTRADREKYLGEKTTIAVCEEDREGLYKLAQESIRNGTVISHNFRVIDGNHQYVWLNITGYAFLEEGIPVFYVSFTDVTEQLRQRELVQAKYEQQLQYVELLSSDAMASSMVNLTKNIITQQRTADGSIMEVITRQTPQEGFELMYTHIPDPEIRKEYEKIFNRDTIIADLKKGNSAKSIVHPQDSFNFWLESGYIAVENPENGDVEAYCYAKDVSDAVLQNNVSSLIMGREYETVTLLDVETGLPTKALVESEDAATSGTDPAAQQEPYWKKRIRQAYTKEEYDSVMEKLSISRVREALSREPSYSVMFSEYLDVTGQMKRKKTTFMYVDRYQSSVLSLTQDVTLDFEAELRQRDELQAALNAASEANRAKADFYARMSHDMRTPMNGILGLTELAAHESNLAILHEDIEKIRQSGVYMLSLINDTLDMQRIESGRMTLEPIPCRTKELIDGAISMLQMSAKEKNIAIDVKNINVDLTSFVRVDPVRIRQIVINLISNSIKFTPEGGRITFTIEALSRDRQYTHSRLTISDTGVGMSREFMEHGIFLPFMQERNDMTMKYAGSGLGLSIVKKLLDLMNARIEVESEPGMGTTFTIYVDFENVSDSEAAAAASGRGIQGAKPGSKIQGKHILLCEDNGLNAEIARRLLEKAGARIDWAKDGAEGIHMFEESPEHAYDLIIMDIRMPNMDGIEAAKAIRRADRTDGQTVPIIAMSANAYADDIEKSMKAGMNAHLAKPIEPGKMFETIERYLK